MKLERDELAEANLTIHRLRAERDRASARAARSEAVAAAKDREIEVFRQELGKVGEDRNRFCREAAAEAQRADRAERDLKAALETIEESIEEDDSEAFPNLVLGDDGRLKWTTSSGKLQDVNDLLEDALERGLKVFAANIRKVMDGLTKVPRGAEGNDQ